MKESSKENCGVRAECVHERILGKRKDCKCVKFGMVPCWIFDEPGYIYHRREGVSKREMKVLRAEILKFKSEETYQMLKREVTAFEEENKTLHSRIKDITRLEAETSVLAYKVLVEKESLQAQVLSLQKEAEQRIHSTDNTIRTLQAQVISLQNVLEQRNHQVISLQTEVDSCTSTWKDATRQFSYLQCPHKHCKPPHHFFSNTYNLNRHIRDFHRGIYP
mmetsp:Transcript_32257/g.54357  ORF Transcript_32257/g.54357 Transcript_32257/m.54357 type:complete len:220 (+) Transcript_32257:256-915(+)